ncbi:MAG: right-handed parallel beta-helix repeat-containing protein [Phycisphaerales bacterium]|nr:right-handed parallel beta-helix repeat-containing protein [Phycisphaerales bacterium]
MFVTLVLPLLTGLVAVEPLPNLEVTVDNTKITKSCRVVIPKDMVLVDADDNGVIQVVEDGVKVEFAPGSVLRGSKAGAPYNEFTGTGIRIEKHKDVTITGAVIEGFKVGIHASNADGLTVERADVRSNYRMQLRSSPQAEDGADWLWPHKNDQNEWARNYGAAVYVEDSSRVTLRGNRVRESQNGLALDRVNGSKVYDNDASFLSGWGLAMWRSSENIISRNAVDFCVRGYSHGVYNRGQDSAGMLVFEQCSNNTFIENSATHGGDGFFGFAGHEALGENPAPSADFGHKNRGCNGNIFVRNDFSYAPAHGLELTFSFDNWIIDNRFVENAICGIWGGYSQRMNVRNNEFTGNGLPRSWEGGAINSEHAVACVYAGNTFSKNSTAIGLWWDNDEGLLKTPWGKANNTGCDENMVVTNSFAADAIALRLNDAGTVTLYGNSPEGGFRIESKGKTTINNVPTAPNLAALPTIAEPIGETRPVGARSELRGRQNIIMGEWGPWDHESPMFRVGGRSGDGIDLQVFGNVKNLKAEVVPAYSGQPVGHIVASLGSGPVDGSKSVLVRATRAGVAPYAVKITGEGIDRTVRGTIIQADWKATFFSWADQADPREDLAGWRKLATSERAVTVDLKSLSELPYGHGGPKDQPAMQAMRDRLPGADKFGMIARTTLDLPKGKWKFSTLSDDGVRVTANGRNIIENWSWHAPTPDSGVFEQAAAGPVEIVVEHFEIDGFATLSLAIEPAE